MSQQKHEVHDGEILDLVDVVAAADKEEVDSRSVYVGNVDYACTAEMVQEHFSTCGTVNRVTILTDKTGKPKGYAYIEFCELHAVQFALQLDESVLYRRHLKVLPKRTNVPGLKQFRTRKFIPPVPKKSPFMSYKRPCFPSNFANHGDARNASRFKKVMRYKPYH